MQYISPTTLPEKRLQIGIAFAASFSFEFVRMDFNKALLGLKFIIVLFSVK